jgi:hypothetical protein
LKQAFQLKEGGGRSVWIFVGHLARGEMLREADVAPPADRRARILSQIMEHTGTDEAMIERLVHSFYAQGTR